MKSCVFGKWAAALLCLTIFAGGGTTSCSSDKEEPDTPGHSKELVLRFIEYRLFDWKGNVNANKQDSYQPGEYNLLCVDESDVRGYFTAMTGIEVPAADTYEATYRSSDGTCVITIEGTRVARNGLFADIRFSVPEFPQIELIHFGTMEIMQSAGQE